MMPATFLHDLVRQLRRGTEPPRRGVSDTELLERFRATGDPEAFEMIVRRHGGDVLSVCRKLLSSAADVDDAFQATFIVLWRSAGSVRKREALGGWLCGVAHRIALKALAEAARRRRAEQRKQPAAAEAPDLSWREACAILHEELDKLPDKYRLPLILCYLEGKSRDEAGRQLGVRSGVVRGRLARGRDRLRERLLKRGIALSAGLLAVVTTVAAAGGPPSRLVRAAVSAAQGMASPRVAALVPGAAAKSSWKPLLYLCALLLGGGLVAGAVVARAPHPPQAAASESPVSRTVEPPKDAPAVTVRGTVLGPDGKPVAGAKVYVDPKRPAATTGDDGAFVVTVPADAPRVLIPGRDDKGVAVLARADGYGPDWATVPLDDNAVTLRLVKDDVPIRGRLRDLEGKPAAGVRVEVFRVSAATKGDVLDAIKPSQERGTPPDGSRPLRELPAPFLGLVEPAVTDADGRFRLTGVGRDRLVGCRLSGPTIERAVVSVVTRDALKPAEDVRPGAAPRRPYPATFEHLVPPGLTLRGVVRERGTNTPLAGITVRDLRTGAEAKSDEQGRYEMSGVPKQSKSPVFAVPPDGSAWFTTSAVVADEPGLGPLRADFELHRGIPFRGKVTDADGKPVQARVQYQPVYPNPHVATVPGGDNINGFETVSVRTREDGSFTVAVLPGPGAVLITPNEPGFRAAGVDPRKFFAAARADSYAYGDRDHVTIQLGGGGATQLSQEDFAAIVLVNPAKDARELGEDVKLGPARRMDVEVADADGKPLTGVRVRGLTSNGSAWRTQAAASFAVANWNPVRPRRLEFRHDERQLAGYAELRADSKGPVRVRLQTWGTITGRVLNEDGKPWAEVTIVTQAAASEPESGSFGTVSVRTDQEGRFRVEGVVPGLEYTLHGRTVRPSVSRGTVAAKLVLRPGETKDLGDCRLKKSNE
jgi:RNA polymerase sigma factor (sigma-70 family)